MSEFGDELKALRKEKKLTQHACGDLLGVNWCTVWRWENGQATPNLLTIKGALKALEDYEGGKDNG